MNSSFLPFSQAVWGGVITVNVFAILASVALCSVFLRIAWLAGVALKTRQQPPEFIFFKTQLGFYAASLLFSNFMIAGSGLVDVYWLANRGVISNNACITQAITMQIGNVAAAYFTVAISLHTFLTLVLQVRQSALIALVFILLGWVTSLVVGVTPHFKARVYGPAGIACAVSPAFSRSQFFLHLLPIFIAVLASALLASLIFLVLRGTLVVRGGLSLTLDPARRIRRSNLLEQGTYNAFMLAIGKAVLWIPLAYVTFLSPYSVTQMLMLAGFQVAFQVQVFAAVCWFMIGVVNVLLFYNIFRLLGPVIAVRSQLISASTVEKGPYTPSFISAGFAEKQQHNRRPSGTDSIMSTASSRPLIRHDLPGNYIGQPIIPNPRTHEETAAFFRDVPEVPPSYSSPYHKRHDSNSSLGSRSTHQGLMHPQYIAPMQGMMAIHAGEFKSANNKAPAPQNDLDPSSPNSLVSTKPPSPSVPQDLDIDPPADHYPRASYFETYYGISYLPITRPASRSPRLKPLLLQGGPRDR